MRGNFLLLSDDSAENDVLKKIFFFYRNDMYTAAYGILKNEKDAEDAVSEAFMSIIGKPHLLKAGECSETYAYLIAAAKNEAEKMLEQERKIKKYNGNINRIRNKLSVDDIIDARAAAAELKEESKEIF